MRPRLFPAFVIAATAVAGSWALPATTSASPLDDARAEAARVEQQLATQAQRVSELDERYNQARLAADRAEGDLARADAALRESRDRLARARAQLATHATRAYVHGGSAPVLDQLVRTPGPDFGVRRRYLETALGVADRALRDVKTAQRDLGRHKDAMARARDDSRAAAARLGADRDAAAAAVSAQEATLARVRSEVSRLIADDEARIAAEAARRAGVAAAAAATEARRTAARSTSAVTASPRPPVIDPGPPATGAAVAVAEAIRQLGKPYEWAGAGPDSFDCSGLTLWAWRAAGVRLSHSAEYQFGETRRVDPADLQPGDLVFFGDPIHHVGIYVGDDTMIEAPHSGAVVGYASIRRSDFAGAGRP
jgi:cell wall-associated NlpC family hydrolase